MDTSNTTLDDLASLTPENYRRALTQAADFEHHMRKVEEVFSRPVKRPYRGRQVLIPGRRKAARHPWADRLHAARTAGLVVEAEGDYVGFKCYACGEGGGIAGTFTASDDDLETQRLFDEDLRRHESRECVAVTR